MGLWLFDAMLGVVSGAPVAAAVGFLGGTLFHFSPFVGGRKPYDAQGPLDYMKKSIAIYKQDMGAGYSGATLSGVVGLFWCAGGAIAARAAGASLEDTLVGAASSGVYCGVIGTGLFIAYVVVLTKAFAAL